MRFPLAFLGLLLGAVFVQGAPKSRCATCHPAQSTPHAATGMANAMQPAASAPILKAHPKLGFRQDPYTYSIERKGDESIYRVSDAARELRANIRWAFGLGTAGQTYLLERDGHWYESRVSYYKDIDSLDLTTGARPDVPATLEEALGRQLSPKGALECFHCHSTGALVEGSLRVEQLVPGVQCQRCHEKSDAHAVSFESKGAKIIPPRLGSQTAEETLDFCGQCHRTWSQIAANGPHNITNVRFQPYRLTNSKCYDTADARIRCITCHDAHTEAPQPSAYYDAKCQACHSSQGKTGAKQCSVGKAGCAGCHMPKVALRETHTKFTDHWIRIARPGDPTPP